MPEALIGGKFTPVPPRTPAHAIVAHLASYLAAEEITDVTVQMLARRVALTRIGETIERQLAALNPIRVPASPQRQDGQDIGQPRSSSGR